MQALSGIRVLEFTANIAGSLAGQTLGALGADVIKIERPTGDDCRAFGPPFVEGASMMYHTMNRGKRGVCLDLKSPQAIAWVESQLEHCDVLIENLRPGTMDEVGLGAASVRARHPRLVYCSVSAFGPTGPLRDKPGYEEVVEAFAGVFSVNGDEAGRPSRVGFSVLDIGTGMWAALGCMAALMQRSRSGEGCVVTGSLVETALAMLSIGLAGTSETGRQAPRTRSGAGVVCVQRCFDTLDGEIVIAAGNDRLFAKLAALVGRPEWAADERYRTGKRRVEHREFIHSALEPIFRAAPSAHWIERLDAAGVPCAPVNSLADVLAEPHVRQLDMFDEVPGARALLARLPLRFDGRRPLMRGTAPALGAHGHELGAPAPEPGRD